MYQCLLQDSRYFELLLKLDEDLAAEARRVGCGCGGVLHSARYERKPRGGPAGLEPESAVRFSFCCATQGCRRRVTPPSLRFLGRKVFFGVLVLLVPVLRDGTNPERLKRLCERFAVSARTLRRWIRFWRETFVTSRVWQAARGRFASPVREEAMPGSLLGAFSEISDTESRVVAVLRLVSPIGTGSIQAF
ncbi:MAG: hypothetical protein ACREKB_16605 [Candidatus Rokuibacteriota bacterium]